MALKSLCDGGKANALARVAMPAIKQGSANAHAATNSYRCDDLEREVYGVLGVPIDVTDMTAVLQKIASAATNRSIFFISTVNLNFLVTSLTNPGFRDSLLLSDLCSADGMPVVWIARLLGAPIKERIAGSDMFDVLRSVRRSEPLKIFLFGSEQNVASEACNKINAEQSSLVCVGSFYPGFGSIDEMSTDAVINTVNSSNADFLAAALGAEKGQAWLLQNYARLQIPVRAHLGATINFQAGTIKRAPRWMRQFGLEWLWRILEEPRLWRRYCRDGLTLAQLVITRVLPLMVLARWHAFRCRREKAMLFIERTEDNESVYLGPDGLADAGHINVAVSSFRAAVTANKHVVINFAKTRLIDPRFLGLLLMLDKHLKKRDLRLTFMAVPPRIRRLFRLNGFGFLLRRVEKA
jgi:N-acetylglucosaminyldiphosphoundecaprenol N-acetyl-beta-D-mannosaminyltransferase